MDGASLWVDAVVAQPRPGVRRVAQEQAGGVDQNTPAGLCGNGETPKNRTRESVLDSAYLRRIVALCTETVVGLDHQNLGSDAFEAHNPAASVLPAVESDVVRAEAGGEPVCVEELGIEAGDFHP